MPFGWFYVILLIFIWGTLRGNVDFTLCNTKNRKDDIMPDRFSRTVLLYGDESIDILAKSRVAVFGVGGVGGYTVEALARSGIGCIDLIDNDKVALSNINRQIIATTSTVGQYKVDVAAARIKDINPEAVVKTYKTFYLPETSHEFDFTQYDYIVDAIDTVKGKIELVMKANECNTPIISSMGAGNKINPSAFEVADIYKTSVCPLARVMRTELKKRGIKKLKVVYSKEKPITPLTSISVGKSSGRRQTPGSTAFAPSVAGLIIAGEIINDLTGKKPQIG